MHRRLIAAAVALPALLATSGCVVSSNPYTPTNAGGKIEFRVTSTRKVNIIWGTSKGTSQVTAKPGKWSKTATFKTFDAATIVASNADVMHEAKITCEILVNGVSKVKNSGSGQMAGANCMADSMS